MRATRKPCNPTIRKLYDLLREQKGKEQTVLFILDHSGGWCVRGGGGGLADGGPPSASSSSSSTMASQEVNLLMPGNQVSWWPRQGWEPWVQRGNNVEPTRELDTKLDVTPESNDTSISEVVNERIDIFRIFIAFIFNFSEYF